MTADIDLEGQVFGTAIIAPDNGSVVHGFAYEILEPCTQLVLGLGAVMLRRK